MMKLQGLTQVIKLVHYKFRIVCVSLCFLCFRVNTEISKPIDIYLSNNAFRFLRN